MGLPLTLAVAPSAFSSLGFAFHRMKLPTGEADLRSFQSLAGAPDSAEPVEHDRGPVLDPDRIYASDKADRRAFLKALDAPVARAAARRRLWLGHHRGRGRSRRSWSNGLWSRSWAEHLRQHKRVSKADADIQDDVRRYHKGAGRAGRQPLSRSATPISVPARTAPSRRGSPRRSGPSRRHAPNPNERNRSHDRELRQD